MSALDDFFPGNIGAFTGMPVVETKALPFDGVLVDTFHNHLLVGEVGHLLYLIALYNERLAAREWYAAMIADFERSVLTGR